MCSLSLSRAQSFRVFLNAAETFESEIAKMRRTVLRSPDITGVISRPPNVLRAKQKADSYKSSSPTSRAVARDQRERAWRKMMGCNGALIVLPVPHNLE